MYLIIMRALTQAVLIPLAQWSLALFLKKMAESEKKLAEIAKK